MGLNPTAPRAGRLRETSRFDNHTGVRLSQIIFFENQAAFDQFTGGNFEFGAGVSAVAIKSGASGSVGTTAATASASSSGGQTGVRRRDCYEPT
jgi:lipid-binding SYLF domain-containing protein